MKLKTSELTGVALDWAVAKCEGLLAFSCESYGGLLLLTLSTGETEYFNPTIDWAQGGPIIEREGIRISDEPFRDGNLCFVSEGVGHWYASHKTWCHTNTVGTTPLIAAMRCYVASQLGDTVEIPDTLG